MIFYVNVALLVTPSLTNPSLISGQWSMQYHVMAGTYWIFAVLWTNLGKILVYYIFGNSTHRKNVVSFYCYCISVSFYIQYQDTNYNVGGQGLAANGCNIIIM